MKVKQEENEDSSLLGCGALSLGKYLTVFYIHGSVHRESNLMTVQKDASYSIYYIL